MDATVVLVAAILLSVAASQDPEGTAVVRGRVVDGASGKPLRNLSVHFNPQPRFPYTPGIDPEPPSRSALTDANGAFDVARLVAAEYAIYAGGVYVRGRATFEGGPAPGARSSPSLALGPADADALIDDNGGIFAPIAADGSFTLTGVPPGRYVMHAMTSSSDGWRLASAKVGELDIADVPLAVDREDVGGVAVIMTMSRGLLRGRVTWKTGDPANGVDVIAFPTEEKYRVRDSRRVATAHTTIAGEYEIAELPPGTYGIAVADDVDVQALKDPGVVRRLRAISTVTLAAGETRVHDVTVR
jgi:hypothetical protein